MANVFTGIGGAFFLAAFVLQIIGLRKEIPLMQKITKPVPAAMIIMIFILTEKNYLPDARFLMINGTLSLFYAFAGTVLFIFRNKKPFRTAGKILFLAGIAQSISVTFPSFRLYSLPVPVSLTLAAVYAAALLAGFFIFIKDRKTVLSVFYFLSMATASFYSYSALLTFSGDTKIYSGMLFSGSLVLLARVFIQTKNESEGYPKRLSVASFALETAAALLFASGCVLMQAV